jgi:REP element-mobilizing transposase RayT
VRRGGRAVLMGNIRGGLTLEEQEVSSLLRREATVRGSWNSRAAPEGANDWTESLARMGRGIEKRKIFFDDQDRLDFINRLEKLVKEDSMDIYAWALLPNHFHILCKTKRRPLSSIMRKLLTGYAVKFNRRHRRYGHLFQNRYKSILCEEEPYLLELTRYIHLNPLRSGIVSSLEELNHYSWTGHSAIMGIVEASWQDTETVLGYFGRRKKESRSGYKKFMEEGDLFPRPKL